MPGTTHNTKVFLQVEPSFYRNGETVSGFKVVGFTQKRPLKPRGGSVVIGLTLEIPDVVFMPLKPEAIVVIPADLAHVVPIEVQATDANAPEPEETP